MHVPHNAFIKKSSVVGSRPHQCAPGFAWMHQHFNECDGPVDWSARIGTRPQVWATAQ